MELTIIFIMLVKRNDVLSKLREVEIVSIFFVSDLLIEDNWEPGFHKVDYKKNMHDVLDLSIEFLQEI